MKTITHIAQLQVFDLEMDDEPLFVLKKMEYDNAQIEIKRWVSISDWPEISKAVLEALKQMLPEEDA